MVERRANNHQNKASEFCLGEEEIRRLIEAAPSLRDKVLVEVLYYAGLRREEACNLRIEDVDLQRHRIWVAAGKGGKSRFVPITEGVAQDLKRLIGRRRKGYVFTSQRSKQLSPRTVNHIVAKVGKLAGVKNPNPRLRHLNPHLLRHSFARHYLKRGGDLRKLSQILGHSSVVVTHSTYGTASEEEIADEYRRLMSG